VNSSCVGKTRAILEYAKTQRVVYFLCKDVVGGLLLPGIFTTMIARWLKEDENGGRECVADKILDCLFEAASMFPDAMELYNAQFENYKLGGKYHEELENIWEKVNAPDQKQRLVTAEKTKTTQMTDRIKTIVVA